MRATIVASIGADGEQEAATAWLARWRPHLEYCSENQGCGCCVDIWDVEAPAEALAELPDTLQAMSEWTHPDLPELGTQRKDSPGRE